MFFFNSRKKITSQNADYWSAGTVAGSKEHLGTVKKASLSRKQGCCSDTQLAGAVAAVISPFSSSVVTVRYVIVEQRPQQYIKHEQYQYRPQFLQHSMSYKRSYCITPHDSILFRCTLCRPTQSSNS